MITQQIILDNKNMYICRQCGTVLNLDNRYLSHIKKNNKICKACFNKQSTIINKKINNRIKQSEKRLILKEYVINKYGGACECCGIDNLQLLSIDHIDGNGASHRKSIKKSAGAGFYSWLKKNNFPDGFRTLCYNCNCALGHCGYCPHKSPNNREIKITKNTNIKIGYCRICDDLLSDQNQYAHHIKDGKNICKSCFQYNESNRLFGIKCKLINKYGGRCVGCGEENIEFLTIDHINNDGAQERKETGRFGAIFYRYLLKTALSDKYQILCYNCNCSKEYFINRKIKVSDSYVK
jgi:hypothetical protein